MKLSEQYHELSFYTLAHPDQVRFIHQHIVDAYIAQTADSSTKPISLVFSLVGLYLLIEKQYTGRQIQHIHQQLARDKKMIPHINPPDNRGNISVFNVLAASPGKERDEMIEEWCRSVWKAYQEAGGTIVQYCIQAFERINLRE